MACLALQDKVTCLTQYTRPKDVGLQKNPQRGQAGLHRRQTLEIKLPNIDYLFSYLLS